MRQTRFGIFLPVQNGALYIQEAIESVISQNEKDWSLFVLDNASSDNTVRLVAAYQHPRIHIYQTESDLTIWESWHRVWTLLADGLVSVKFATIMGHDDILLPTFLDSIDQLIIEQPSASLYQVGFDMIDELGNIIRPCRPIPSHESSEDFLATRLWGLRDSVGIGYVFRSADYVSVGGIPNLPSLLYADDLLFARLARISFKAALPNSECLYRLHRASASNQMTGERIKKQISALLEFVEILEKEFPEFMNSSPGKNALANLLAREVFVLAPLAKSCLLDAKTRKQIAYLKDLYNGAFKSIDYRQWLGTNFVTQRIYVYAKRLMLVYVLLKGKSRLLHRRPFNPK